MPEKNVSKSRHHVQDLSEDDGEQQSPRGSADRLTPAPEVPRSFPSNPTALFPRERHGSMTPSVQELTETVPRRSYDGFVNYIRAHQQLIGPDSAQDLVSEAIKAMRMRQRQHAENCIEKSLLLKECSERQSDLRKLADYLKVLQKNQLPNKEQFAARRKRVLEHCEKRAEELGFANVESQSQKAPEYPGLTKDPSKSQMDAVTADFGGMNIRPGMSPPNYPQNFTWKSQNDLESYTNRQTETALGRRDSVGSQINVRGGNPLRQIEESAVFQEETGLKGSFKQRFRNEARDFFRVGRVFMIFLHQEFSSYKKADEAASTQGLLTHNKKLDMYIISHKTRFVVVREGPAYCWAIPINTYSGRGLHKPGLKPEDVRAHAIVYTSESPRTLVINDKDEPRMTKRPLKVNRAQNNDECSLHRASRVNFARPTTIEHNVNAVNIGLVHRDDRPYLEQYWEEQVRGRDVQGESTRHK